MRFAPLQGPTARAHLTTRPDLARIDSIVLIRNGGAVVRSEAVLGIIDYLGWPWKILLLGALIPRRLRDGLYDVVAGSRKRIFGGYQSCPRPPASGQGRFLA